MQKFNHDPRNVRPIDPSKNPLVMSLDQATCGQDTYGLYFTLLEDIFLNGKHAIFLKIFNFDTLLTHKCFKHDCRLLIHFPNIPKYTQLLLNKNNGIIFTSHVRKLAPHIISHFKNDTMITKIIWQTTYLL